MRLNKNKLKRLSEYIYLFLLGIIGFSRLSQYVIFDVFHLPFYFIELYFVPFFIVKWKEYSKYIVKISKTKKFAIWTLVLVVDVLIGCVVSFNIIDTVTMTRSLIYIVYIALIFEQKKKFTINKIFVISLGSIIGEYIYSTRYLTGDVASINTTCLAIILIAPIMAKRYILFSGCALFGLLVAINSGYRLGIVVILLVTIECVAWIVFANRENLSLKEIGKKLFIPLMIFILLAYTVSNYENIIKFASGVLGTSQYAIWRVTARLRTLFSGDLSASRDSLRVEVFKYAITAFVPSLLPKGLVGKTMGTLHYYYDVPIVYLYDAFGSIPAYIIAFICSIKGFKCFLGAFKRNTPDYYVLSGLMFPVLFLCLILNGSFLYITFQVIMTGMFLGEWFAYDKELRIRNVNRRRLIDNENSCNYAD